LPIAMIATTTPDLSETFQRLDERTSTRRSGTIEAGFAHRTI
jgi:hypothetical protein